MGIFCGELPAMQTDARLCSISTQTHLVFLTKKEGEAPNPTEERLAGNESIAKQEQNRNLQ